MDDKNEKLCPVLTLNTFVGTSDAIRCSKEKCAWWIEDKQKCAIAVIGGKK